MPGERGPSTRVTGRTAKEGIVRPLVRASPRSSPLLRLEALMGTLGSGPRGAAERRRGRLMVLEGRIATEVSACRPSLEAVGPEAAQGGQASLSRKGTGLGGPTTTAVRQVVVAIERKEASITERVGRKRP